MLLLTIDRTSAVPVYRQVCDRIVQLVDAGTLVPGDRLPPTRVLAQTSGISRSSVLHAYGELWALGYLESRQGSYSTIRRRVPVRAAGEASDRPLIDWPSSATPAARRACAQVIARGEPTPAAPGTIDFARLSADRRLTPLDDLRRCLKMTLLMDGPEVLDYGPAAGHRQLREVIARQLRVHGVAVSADEVLITAGAQHATDLVLRWLTQEGDAIAVEAPTYSSALSLFRLHGLETLPIPMTADGLSLDVLEQTLAARRPRLLYTIPSFHNPTGITTSQAHRERLLALCESHRVPILEDGFEEEMKYFGKAVLPIKSMDRHGSVLYVGTLSKVVFPGLRIGWIAAPRECVAQLAALQRATSLAGNMLSQAVAARFCGTGFYEAHLRRAHKVYRRRMQTMMRSLSRHVPAGAEWTRPAGGYTLWMRIPGGAPDESSLVEQLQQGGVKVSPGSHYFDTPPAETCLRLSIACVEERDIEEGCRRLGEVLRRTLQPHSVRCSSSPATEGLQPIPANAGTSGTPRRRESTRSR